MNALIQWNISTYMVSAYINSTFMNISIHAYVSPMFVIHHNYMNSGCLYSCSFKHIASGITVHARFTWYSFQSSLRGNKLCTQVKIVTI